MRQYPLPLALATFLLLGAGCIGASVSQPARPQAPAPAPAVTQPTTPAPAAPAPAAPTTPHTGGNADQPAIFDLVTVNSPISGAKITSPVAVTGQARGYWYFEASFPVEVQNAAGTVIGQGAAHAGADWMTQDYVPFTASITFPAQPAGSTGTLVLRKDDPSGEHPDSVSLPITF